MLMDKENILADNLDVKSSSRVPSTSIDQLVAGNALGKDPWVRIQVSAAFTRAAGAIDTVFSLETSASDSFGSAATVLWTSGVLAKAALGAGAVISFKLPPGSLRFINLVTDNVNAADAANIDAFLTPDVQLNNL